MKRQGRELGEQRRWKDRTEGMDPAEGEGMGGAAPSLGDRGQGG